MAEAEASIHDKFYPKIIKLKNVVQIKGKNEWWKHKFSCWIYNEASITIEQNKIINKYSTEEQANYEQEPHKIH